jgi:hypothetical protein
MPVSDLYSSIKVETGHHWVGQERAEIELSYHIMFDRIFRKKFYWSDDRASNLMEKMPRRTVRRLFFGFSVVL